MTLSGSGVEGRHLIERCMNCLFARSGSKGCRIKAVETFRHDTLSGGKCEYFTGDGSEKIAERGLSVAVSDWAIGECCRINHAADSEFGPQIAPDVVSRSDIRFKGTQGRMQVAEPGRVRAVQLTKYKRAAATVMDEPGLNAVGTKIHETAHRAVRPYQFGNRGFVETVLDGNNATSVG